ncbi:MAG: decaprenyl-phosphate phosphoribosyltransferase, partial [Solirubrobacteraceae bacterium]
RAAEPALPRPMLRPPAGVGGDTASVADGMPAPASARVLLRACRPRQWSKNLLVLAAPSAAGVIDRPLVAAQVAGAFVVLCLLSSATYLVNDVRDREQDRLHPRKRLRPIAAGELSPAAALRYAAVLAVVGVGGASAIRPSFGLVALGYLALTASYSLLLRRVFILDIVAIAAGFVLRAFAGGVASDIYLSRWFVIVTACCAIFLVAAKRYAELREHADTTRATLRRYSLPGLRLVLAATAGAGGVAYIGWAFTRPAHLLWYVLSIGPFLGWLARYAQLIGAGAGQAPEELILRDRVLLGLTMIWSLLFLGGVYVGH